jgi:cephalosporin hydroxylase
MNILMSILSYSILDNIYIIILFLIWGLVIIIIQRVYKSEIRMSYKFVSLFILSFILWTLPIYINYDLRKNSIKYFHREFYNSRNQFTTFWLAVPAAKNPLDMWVYQEIIYEIKPDVIVECGTAHGGSALFFANLFDLMKNGKVITIDIEDIKGRPQHDRIIYLHGSSTSEEIISKVKSLIRENDKVLVSLDSDHSKQHVLKELSLYSKLVSKGSYIVVEDTNINGHPVLPGYGEGPMEAVSDFLINNNDFIIDKSREKYLLTFYPKGWLKKVN